MQNIPKSVERLLYRRRKLAGSLMDVCSELDKYCERIGIDLGDDDVCLCSHIMIYTEPFTAYGLTRNAIQCQLQENEIRKNGKRTH